MLKKLESFIVSANFIEAEELFKKSNFEDFSEEIMYISYENNSIINYSFLNYLMVKEESKDLHDLAFSLLVNPLCHIEGAYNSALYHAKRSVALTEGKNVGSLENLLFLNSIPDKLINNQDAIDICNQILKLDNSNEIAQSTIEELS